jgi:hypothetical protein
MEVSLYMYDLSRGLVRMMSASLIGVQLDAMYHTSIVLEGVEYVRSVPTSSTNTLLINTSRSTMAG